MCKFDIYQQIHICHFAETIHGVTHHIEGSYLRTDTQVR